MENFCGIPIRKKLIKKSVIKKRYSIGCVDYPDIGLNTIFLGDVTGPKMEG